MAKGPTISSTVARILTRHVTEVFGVMGNGNAYFLDALHHDGIEKNVRYTAVRHEAGAVIAADAYYRASGRLAVATTTYGPGFTNTLTALTESVQARVPVLLVVGDAPSAGPRPWDIDQAAVAERVGARTFTVGPTDADAVTAQAVQHALEHRTAAVLAIPHDLATAPFAASSDSMVHSVALPAAVVPDPHDVERIMDLLSGAQRPMLLAGRGAWLCMAGAALGRLADVIGAVTASTALGRGIFPDARYDLGVTGGFGQERAMDLVREADVVVAFGASLNQFTTRFGALFAEGTHVVQVDVEEGPSNPVATDFVHGDAALVAESLGKRLLEAGVETSRWRESVDFGPLRVRDEGAKTAPDGRLDPRSVAARIGELLPEDRVVVSDGGHFIGWANMYWPVTSPDRMMMVGTAFQSIGFGTASVVGAARARPESTIVLTTGDGGALMGLADLESAVRTAAGHGLAVVWNDAAYGAEVNLYGLKGLADPPMRIPEVDFSAVARGFGAESVSVRSLADLDALAEWASRSAADRAFLVLDCRISPDVIAPYQQEIIARNR